MNHEPCRLYNTQLYIQWQGNAQGNHWEVLWILINSIFSRYSPWNQQVGSTCHNFSYLFIWWKIHFDPQTYQNLSKEHARWRKNDLFVSAKHRKASLIVCRDSSFTSRVTSLRSALEKSKYWPLIHEKVANLHSKNRLSINTDDFFFSTIFIYILTPRHWYICYRYSMYNASVILSSRLVQSQISLYILVIDEFSYAMNPESFWASTFISYLIFIYVIVIFMFVKYVLMQLLNMLFCLDIIYYWLFISVS